MLVALADHSGKWAARSGVRQHDAERLVRLADAIVGHPKLDLTVRITTVIRVIGKSDHAAWELTSKIESVSWAIADWFYSPA